MTKLFSLPGTAWVAALTFLTTWLTQYFDGSLWVPTAVAVIGGVIKMLELVTEPKPPAPPPGALGDPMPAVERPNAVVRWLVG